MSFRTVLPHSVHVLFPLALLSTTYLYLYPVFHGCAFPSIDSTPLSSWRDTLSDHLLVIPGSNKDQPGLAPFRFLVLADPQIEGDSSLPDPDDGFLRRLALHSEHVFAPHQRKSQRKQAIRKAQKEILFRDIPDLVRGLRKRLDLFGNDYYLAHIFRSLHWWSKPTHTTVLGDLIGSQWVTDEEFDARAWRYWNRVFGGSHRVEHEAAASAGDEIPFGHAADESGSAVRLMHNSIINIAGNHDIGYAGDASRARIERFEKHYGRVNWDTRLRLPHSNSKANTSISPSLHLIVLNDLVLDTPALDSSIQSESYNYINSVITARSNHVEDRTSFTLLLTHVPLHKPEGVCVDAPLFAFHDSDDWNGEYISGGLKEQNHLSDHVSRSGILEGIYGMTEKREAAGRGKGRNGLVLTGHDHEGCDTWHHLPHSPEDTLTDLNNHDSRANSWHSTPWRNASVGASYTGIREITLRSMMGEFGGNAGLLSLWFDFEKSEWQYEMQMCQLGIQHIWWGIHILDLVTVCVVLLWVFSLYLTPLPVPSADARAKSKMEIAEKSSVMAG